MEEFFCDVWYTINVLAASNRVADCFTPLQIKNGKNYNTEKRLNIEIIFQIFQMGKLIVSSNIYIYTHLNKLMIDFQLK